MKPRINALAGLVLASAGLFCTPANAAADAPREPITIEADGAVLDERKGESIYTGNVIITQGGMQIRAHEVTMYSEEGELQRVVATGRPVHFRMQREGEEDLLGEAQRLDYTTSNEHLLLQEQAWLTQGKNRFSGQRIEYDMQQERVTAAQAKDGSQRVKVTIQPRDKAKTSPADGSRAP